MGTRTTRVRAIAAAATAAALAVTAAMTASPAEAASIKTVKVRITPSNITFSGGGATTENGVTTLRAGKYHLHVVAPKGHAQLQLLRFKNGYTPEQFMADADKAFSGDVPTVQRVDQGVDFRGGVSARPHHPGDMAVKLGAGQFFAADFDSSAHVALNIVGKAPNQPRVPHSGKFTAFSYGWGVSKHLPASGTVKFANQADQPHIMELQRVKASTTAAQVRKFIKSGAQGNPSWALKAGTGSGFVSAGHSQFLNYDLPAGKYIVLCFYPDYFTGMPHFMMGMWKLVHLS